MKKILVFLLVSILLLASTGGCAVKRATPSTADDSKDTTVESSSNNISVDNDKKFESNDKEINRTEDVSKESNEEDFYTEEIEVDEDEGLIPIDGVNYLALRVFEWYGKTYGLPIFKSPDVSSASYYLVSTTLHNVTLTVDVREFQSPYLSEYLEKDIENEIKKEKNSLLSEEDTINVEASDIIYGENTIFCFITAQKPSSDYTYIIKFDSLNDGKTIIEYKLKHTPNTFDDVDDSDIFNEACTVIGVEFSTVN